jgi:hypothetical protein
MEPSRGQAHPRSSANYCVVAGTVEAAAKNHGEFRWLPLSRRLTVCSGRFPEGERHCCSLALHRRPPVTGKNLTRRCESQRVDPGADTRSCHRLRRSQNGALQDCDHLLHRPLTAILADEDLGDPVGAGFADLSERLTNRLRKSKFPGHTATAIAPTLQCETSGPDKRCSSISMRAAPDIRLMICRIPLQLGPKRPKGSRIVGASIEGLSHYPTLSGADFKAVHLFVPFGRIWLAGEYARPIPGWVQQAVPVDWFAEQLDFMLWWENEKRAPGLLNRCPRRVWIHWHFFKANSRLHRRRDKGDHFRGPPVMG